MNGKRAKQARWDTWEEGMNPRQVAYNEYSPPQFMGFTYGPNGEPVASLTPSFYSKVGKGIPRTMKDCGRSLYKALKAIR